MEAIIPIAIGIILVLGIAVMVFILGSLRNFLRQFRQVLPSALLNQLRRAAQTGGLELQSQEPVSLSGMDIIYGPQIQADFPELNLAEMKQRATQVARDTLESISAGNADSLIPLGELYLTRFRQYLEHQHSQNRRETIRNITIHRIVIADYQKSAGTCRIIFQLSYGADRQIETAADDGQPAAGTANREERKFILTALYVQDADQTASPAQEALAVNCPNCGAPVTTLGERYCTYCRSSLEPINNRVWVFSDFEV